MTELEKHLLAALKDLQQQFETEQAALRTMFDATSKANKTLQEQVLNLIGQVASLSKRLPK